jgi:hypothetical protein
VKGECHVLLEKTILILPCRGSERTRKSHYVSTSSASLDTSRLWCECSSLSVKLKESLLRKLILLNSRDNVATWVCQAKGNALFSSVAYFFVDAESAKGTFVTFTGIKHHLSTKNRQQKVHSKQNTHTHTKYVPILSMNCQVSSFTLRSTLLWRQVARYILDAGHQTRDD